MTRRAHLLMQRKKDTYQLSNTHLQVVRVLMCDRAGQIAPHWALEGDCPEMMLKYPIEEVGATLMQKIRPARQRHRAAQTGQLEGLKYLNEAGANLFAEDEDG